MWFQEISIPTPRSISGNSKVGGGFTSKESMRKKKMEFPEGLQGAGGRRGNWNSLFLEQCIQGRNKSHARQQVWKIIRNPFDLLMPGYYHKANKERKANQFLLKYWERSIECDFYITCCSQCKVAEINSIVGFLFSWQKHILDKKGQQIHVKSFDFILSPGIWCLQMLQWY